jgi:RNA binding exosome subunit
MHKDQIRPFHIIGAEINLLIHATEDRERMLNLITDLLRTDKDELNSTRLIGHWGNHIDMVKARLEGKRAKDLSAFIFSSLDIYDRESLLKSLDDHVDDKGNFHLRVDKQKVCEGKVELSEVDSIKIKFSPKLFFSRIKDDYNSEYRRLLDSND